MKSDQFGKGKAFEIFADILSKQKKPIRENFSRRITDYNKRLRDLGKLNKDNRAFFAELLIKHYLIDDNSTELNSFYNCIITSKYRKFMRQIKK